MHLMYIDILYDTCLVRLCQPYIVGLDTETCQVLIEFESMTLYLDVKYLLI
jgi:hypothetical protein